MNQNRDQVANMKPMSKNMRKIVCQFYSVFRMLQVESQQEMNDSSYVQYASFAYREVIENGCMSIVDFQKESGELVTLQNCEAI